MSKATLKTNKDGVITGLSLNGITSKKLPDGSLAFYADILKVDGKKVSSQKELFRELNK